MKIENTIYLSEVQEQYEQIMFDLEHLRKMNGENGSMLQKDVEWNVALNIILTGARLEMGKTIKQDPSHLLYRLTAGDEYTGK